MSIHRALSTILLLAAVPAVARAQGVAPQDSTPVSVSAFLEGRADSPAFASRRADVALQNVAEVVRQLGGRVARVDTVAYGVTRLPELNGIGEYPPPPYVARYVLRLSLANAGDVPDVTTALSMASRGVVAVRVLREPSTR